GWALAVRLAGSAALVASQEAGLRGASGGRFTALRADEAHGFWMRAAESFATRPVAFRIGGLPDSSDELLDLLQHQVGDEWISASPAIGAIAPHARRSGSAAHPGARSLARALRRRPFRCLPRGGGPPRRRAAADLRSRGSVCRSGRSS